MLLFIIEGEIKTLHDKQKPNQYMTTKPTFQRILKGILDIEEENKGSHEGMKIIKSQGMGR
jgi:hypothetical protein